MMKILKMVVCLAAALAVPVSMVHAMDYEGTEQSPISVIKPFNEACKKLIIGVVSSCIFDFAITHVGLSTTKWMHPSFSGFNGHLALFPYFIPMYNVLFGFSFAYQRYETRAYSNAYTTQDMKNDVKHCFLHSLVKAANYLWVIRGLQLTLSHFR